MNVLIDFKEINMTDNDKVKNEFPSFTQAEEDILIRIEKVRKECSDIMEDIFSYRKTPNGIENLKLDEVVVAFKGLKFTNKVLSEAFNNLRSCITLPEDWEVYSLGSSNKDKPNNRY